MDTAFLYVFLLWTIQYQPDGTPTPMEWGSPNIEPLVAHCPPAPASCTPARLDAQQECEAGRLTFQAFRYQDVETPGYNDHPIFVVELACREVTLPPAIGDERPRVGAVTVPPGCLQDMTSRLVSDYQTPTAREYHRKILKAAIRNGTMGSQTLWNWQCAHP